MTVTFDENGLATQAGEIRVYYYKPSTGEYCGWSDEYINVGVSMPGHSTGIYPGDDIDGFVSIFNGISWESKEDHRGEIVYYIETSEPFLITEIGPYPEGTSTTKPPAPEPSNGEKRRIALLSISNEYQSDITKLNIAWLAAAVSDGVNESVKKDAVIAQINERKAKYAQDRASVIAQYPEE